MSLAERHSLLEHFAGHRLSPVQRRLARYVAAHAEDVVFLSSVDLAAAVGVSQPSVIRFAQALGFRGYPELVGFIRGRLSQRRTGEQGATGAANPYQAAVAAEIENLSQLQEALADPVGVQNLGGELIESRPLVILGLRAAAGVARQFGYNASILHPDVRIATEGGGSACDLLSAAREDGATWALCFVLPRYPSETLHALAHAKAGDLHVATIADQPLVPARHLSDVVLTAGVSSPLLFAAQTAVTTLAMVLLEAMVAAAPERTRRRLRAFEERAQLHGYFA